MAFPNKRTKENEYAHRKVQEGEGLVSDRSTTERVWQETAELIFPAFSRTFSPHEWRTPGDKHTQKIFDASPTVDLNRFVAVMEYLITPGTQVYHQLEPKEDGLRKNRNVRLYLETVNRIVFSERYAARAGFSTQQQIAYKSMGAFGNGGLYLEDLDDATGGEAGIRYCNVPVGELYVRQNFQGIINAGFRYVWMTARQISEHPKWAGNLPERVKVAVENNQGEMKFKVLHVVEERPKSEIDPEAADYRGMPFKSCYILTETNEILSEGGYRTFPFPYGRYGLSPGEIYARGPAGDVLPSIKMLNEMAKTSIKQGHRIVDPSFIASGEMGPARAFSMRPGAVNHGWVSADGKAMIQPLPHGKLEDGEAMMEKLRMTIRAAFLVDIFQILVESPQRTATEVLELEKEKGILLAPTVSALQASYLETLVSREIDLLFWQGRLPPMPPELAEAGGRFKIRFESPMTRLQKAAEASGADRQIQAAIATAQTAGKPEILDVYNFEKHQRGMAEVRGYPEDWLNSEEEIAALREERAEAIEHQQMVESAPGAAALGKVAVLAGGGGAGPRSPKS